MNEATGKIKTSQALWGTACGLLSAVAYTLANISLRSVTEVDPFWVMTIKPVPTVALALPWLLASPRPVVTLHSLGWGWLAGSALIGHLGGNVAFQWSLSVIGLALAVPLMMGSVIFFSSLLGWRLLGERVSRGSQAAMAILVLAIVFLSQGASAANAAMPSEAPWWRVAAAVAAAIESGLAYALLGLAIRNSASRGMPIPLSLLTVAVTGLLCIGAIAWGRLGWEEMRLTPPAEMGQMWMAGVWNAVAFLALTRALALIPLYYVNALNASQTAMAAVAGMLLFEEAASPALLLGLLLTVAGLLLVRHR